MKEQNKAPEKELNKMETSNLLDASQKKKLKKFTTTKPVLYEMLKGLL